MVLQTLHGSLPGNYIQQFVCSCETSVRPEAIARAMSILCDRHEALRLQFHWEGAEITQSVAPAVQAPVELLPWEGEPAWQEFLAADRVRGFDLRHAPLLRVTVFTDAPEATRLVVTNHHALLDGRSRRIVMREFFRLLADEHPTAETLPISPPPFTRYLEWMEARDHSASLPFWREYLRDLTPSADLPLPELPGASRNYGRGTLSLRLDEIATASLRAFANSSACTLNNVLQAAWALVLSRYTGRDDAVFGTTRACRHSAMEGAAANIVGLLINNVPMRVSLPPGMTVRALLTALNNLQRSLRDHENTPVATMVAASGLGSSDALFHSYLMFDDIPAPEASESSGWRCELHEQTEMLNLTARAGSTVALRLEYDRSRYEDDAMARLLEDFSRALRQIAVAPDRELDSLPVFTPSVLITPPQRPEFANVVEAVRFWAQTSPSHPAVLADTSALSYRDLDLLSNRIAHQLIAAGVPAGSVIGVSIEPSPHLIAAFLGIWKAGCAYLPVDPRYPEERRAWMLEDSGAVTVLSALPNCSSLPESASERAPGSASPAYLIYTSGSTGKPKGVLISHASLANLCSAISAEYQIGREDRVLQAATINFDISVEEIFATLWRGATIVPASPGAMSSSRGFTDFVQRWQITVLDLPTAFWHELAVAFGDSEGALPASVRLLAVGGERVLPELYAKWTTLPGAARVRWLNTYGPTETTVTATVFDPQTWALAGSMPIGRPIAGVNCYVLDPRLRPSPLETAGELFIGGAGVALGYLNRPDRTEAKFLPDPWNPGGRMYRTGDRARLLASGEIEYLGRTDFQVKFRGFRIELGEVEIAAEAHPNVIQAVAQVRDGNALVLFVGTAAGPLQSDALLQWLRGKLPAWMLPTAIVPLPKLPTTVGGKIDRDALAALPVSAPVTSVPSQPETELERQLVSLWAALFQKMSIGIDDNFFALGGYSLLAMRMLVQVEKLIGRTVRLSDLSQAPTIRQFARAIAGENTRRLPDCLVVLRDGGDDPPLFCFHGAGGVAHWFNDLASILTDRPVIGIQCPEDPDRPLPSSIEEMCDDYMRAVRQVQPRGPYHFIGHSMGGMLAYHCAVLCCRRGDEVGFAASLDGWNRAADSPTAPQKLVRWVRYFWSLDGREKMEFATEKLRWIRSEGAQRSAQASLDSGSSDLLRSIRANNIRLARAYRAPRYPGVFHVFRARRRSATQNEDPALGWSTVAGSVIAEEVPGDHYTLLSPPNVNVLAESLVAAMPSTLLEVSR